MKKVLLVLSLLGSFAMNAIAEDAAAIKKDIDQHKAMAAAHTAAADCLASGKGHDACVKQLQAACKGIAIGKYCGMKHQH